MSSYEAVRRAASGDGRDNWMRAMDSLAGSGFPDSQMHLDTGHRLWVYHHGRGRDDSGPGFYANVSHPAAGEGRETEGYLGDVPEHVGPQLRRMLMHPDVMQHMRLQMGGYPGLGAYHLDMTRER